MTQETSDFQKIYFQLALSLEARKLLREISAQLQLEPEAVQVTDPDTWHLTVLHIGNLKMIWQQLNSYVTDVSFSEFKSSMHAWAEHQQQQVAGKVYQLPLTGLDFYGGHSSVLAATFEADSGLESDHQRAYNELVDTWTQLGVNQPVMTLRSLPELQFAHALAPHVTLARGVNVNLNLPEFNQQKVSFTPMKFFYGPHE